MKVNNCIYLLLIFVLCLACSKQVQPSVTNPSMVNDDIQTLWNKVDSLEKIGQYRSAMEQLTPIKLKLNDSKDEVDEIKLTFYEAKYRAVLEENSSEQTILEFEKKLETKASDYQLRIYHSLLGQLYADHANANQFKIANRTNIISDTTDISTWGMHQLLQRSNWHFTESIKDNLQKDETIDLQGFLDKPATQHAFDSNTLLLIRAVEHFSREFSIIADQTNAYRIIDEEVFSAKESFIDHDFQYENQDLENSRYITILLYQKLLRYHRSDEAISEKIDIDRLSYMYRVSQSSNKAKLYEDALINLSRTSAYAKLRLANYWINNQWSDKSIDLREARSLLLEVKTTSKDSTLLYDADNLLYSLERPQLNILMEEVLLPNQNTLFNIQYNNIEEINFSIASVPASQLKKYQQARSNEEQLKLLNKLKPLQDWDITLPNSSYRQLSTENKLLPMPVGRYVLLAKHKDKIVANFFQVSNITAHSLTTSTGLNVQVYERDSGKPQTDVKVEVIETNYGRKGNVETVIQSQQTNTEGEATFATTDKRRTRLRFSSANDAYDSDRILNRYYGNNTNQATIHIFTDRNIYRPGDRLQAKAIPVIFDKDKKLNRLLINESLDIVVRDPNYQEIHKEQLSTNEFGSVSFDFVIDDDRLAGAYSIEIRNKSNTIQGSQQFQVEEYKRASFSTSIQFPKEEFVLGDTINVTTVTELFAGAPLTNATLHYRASRIQNNYWHRSHGNTTPNAEIVNGIVQTDTNGAAIFELPLTAPNNHNGNYRFDVEVRVVDSTGETQFASKGINANKVGIFTELDIASVTDNEQLANTKIKTVNSISVPISAELQIEIHQLETPNYWKKKKYWSEMDTMSLNLNDYNDMPYEYVFNEYAQETWDELKTIYEQEITTDSNTTLDIPSLAAGHYVLKIKKDAALITEKRFQIIDFNNAINPSPELISYKLNRESFEPDEELVIDYSIPNEEVQVQYLIEKDGRIIKKDWLMPGGQIKESINQSDRGGFIIHLRSIFQNRIEFKSIVINVPYSNLQLSYKIDSYKSTLLPGEDVLWRIRFEDNEDNPKLTESVWTMYDSSLDQLFRKHDWQKFHLPNYYSRVVTSGYGFNQSYSSVLFNSDFGRIRQGRPNDSWPDLNTYGFRLGQQHGLGARQLKRSGAPMAESSMSADVTVQSKSNDQIEFTDEEVEQVGKDNTQTVRRNFEETVFFYPHILSEKNGEATVQFKMSDALSSWKILMFAHDKDGKFVYDTLELKSSQDIYIIANKPRFSRVNDDLLMTTKIVNNTSRTIPAETWIEFKNLITGEDITNQVLEGNQKKTISARPGSSDAITWHLQFSEDLNTEHIVFRTGVSHDGGSDIVEDYLPIVDNKQLVRESDALILRPGSKHSYALEKFGTGTESVVQVELMTDLEWQVIQSLPYLSEKSFETSSQYLYQFVANSIGSHIIAKNSNVKKQLELLQRNINSAKSKLNANNDNKTIDLKNTPWVRDADKEMTQKENLLKFLDSNELSQNINKSLDKLLSFQRPDGGFSWLKERPSNVFMSGIVLQGIGRLTEKNIAHGFSDEQLTKLIGYVDKHIKKQIAKSERNYFSNSLMLINARSIFHHSHPIASDVIEKLKNKFENNWTEHVVVEQALIGSISKRIGLDKLVKPIFLSITQQAIQSSNLGTYWKVNRNYFSNQSSIDRHVTVMDFLNQYDSDLPLLDEAKIWLLNNKRTNVWEGRPSTSSAVFAFLENKKEGSTMKSRELNDVSLSVNGKSIINDNQIGNGTQRIVKLDLETITDDAVLDIHNTNDSPVWVSIFKQYTKPITQISSFTNNKIKIEKSIFIKTLTTEGPKLLPLTDSDLKPGDRLTVRLIIQNDRSLQFVHVEDKRASGLEPKDVISKYHYNDALSYYQVTKDQTSHFLISHLPKGTHVLEYDLTVNLRGNYSSGYSSIQCQYAPEFGAHSQSVNLKLVE